MEKKLKNWLEQSIAEIKASGDVKNIHIDELLGFELKSKEEFLMRSCEILQQLLKWLGELGQRILQS